MVELNLELIKELTSQDLPRVIGRLELIDQFEAVFKGSELYGDAKLCRTCTTDRKFAYFKLKAYIENGKDKV